jgi:hypothetical protein
MERPRYQTPTAVFDAYREARGKRNYRKVFSCLTSESQNDAIFEAFFTCMEAQGADAIKGRGPEAKGIGRLVGRFLDARTLHDDCEKQYKKKHSIDSAKPLPPDARDDQLWRDVVVSHIKDKAGFYEAVVKHFDERAAKRHEERPVEPLGELQRLDVHGAHGEWATGSAKLTLIPGPGESPPVVNPIDKTFRFRKVNGGWLIDSL